MRFVVACIAIVPTLVAAQSAPPMDRVAGWRSDIDRLVAEAQRQHAGPARPAHDRRFLTTAEQLKARVGLLPDRRVVVELQRLMALLHDGHSLVYPAPTARAPWAMLPIDVYLFRDGLYVTDADPTWRSLVGQRIVRIGALTSEAALRALTPYVSRDNEVGVRAFASMYLISPAFLEAIGATRDSSMVELTLQDSTGRRQTVAMAAGQPRRFHRTIVPPPTAGPAAPYLQQLSRPAFVRTIPGERTVLLQFNQVADAPNERLSAVARQLGDTIARSGATRIIVDVRHNVGGNNELLPSLLDQLASAATGPNATRLCVITSRSTFSAAQNFITRLEKRVPDVVFAGEPSMSSPNFTGEDNPVNLPWSGAVVSISNRYWQDAAPTDRRPWIAPHIPMVPSGADWLANRDTVLNTVLGSPACRGK